MTFDRAPKNKAPTGPAGFFLTTIQLFVIPMDPNTSEGPKPVRGSSVHVKSGSFVHVRRLVVCARFCCVFLSLYLCNMILLLAFFKTSSHNSSSYVFFLTSLSGAFVFRFVFLAFSSFSSWVASFSLNFTQIVSHDSQNSSHTTALISQVTELVSHHSTHLTTHTARLISQVTQLILHKSSLTTHLTQLNLLKSCFRVPFGGAAFVFSHWRTMM